MDVLDRIDRLERWVDRSQRVVTVPIYNDTDLSIDSTQLLDSIIGQIAIQTFTNSNPSFLWYATDPDTVTGWHSVNGDNTPSIVGNIPQDPIEGEIAIGNDGSFHWFVTDFQGSLWRTQGFVTASPDAVPQDSIPGQIAIGTDGQFYWCDNSGTWRGFG